MKFATSLTALLVMGGVVASAHAGQISGTLSGDSTLMPTGTPGVYVQNFTGDGDDTTYGSFTPTSSSTVDFSHPPAIVISDGMFTEIFSQGTLFGTSSGDGTASGMGTAAVTLDLVITGGTGLFAGDTGEATANETIMQTSSTTESATGSYSGFLSTVPEPSSLALLAPAAVIVFGRRRRRAMTC
jgi:hypothetical protein